MMGNLKYVSEHVSCSHYSSVHECKFQYTELAANEKFAWDYQLNLIVFVIQGTVRITHDVFVDREFKKDDIILVPFIGNESTPELDCKLVSIPSTLVSNGDSTIITCSFDVPMNVCDKLVFSQCALKEGQTYNFIPIPINKSMRMFLDKLAMCLQEKIRCNHFQELMEKEMFLFFKYYYTKEELNVLFYPLSFNGQTFDFRKKVFEHYRGVQNIEELTEKIGMSRKCFEMKFKQVFFMPPGKWLKQQRVNCILYHAQAPGVTVGELMDLCNFDRPSSFHRFCMRELGCSPVELLQGKSEIQPNSLT